MICQVGTGDIHVNANVAERTSAPTTASPITRQVMGSTRRNSAPAATSTNAPSGVSSSVVASSPNRIEVAAGTSAPIHRFAGSAERSV